MADSSHASIYSPQPPPAPPLPPSRAGGVFQKFIAPLAFNISARTHVTQGAQSTSASSSATANRVLRNLPSQTTSHRTGIPITAIDINRSKTHAILAGQDILKTIHVYEGRAVEDFNLRSGINSYASAYTARSETAHHRREYLPAKDVCWSKGDKYDTIIATAANNGRIALYDVSRLNSSRIELAWIHEHTGQVNNLDFDPTGGYLLLSGSQDKTVRVWDIREPQSVKRKAKIDIRQPVREVRWSPTDVGEFALCTENGVVERWDLRMPSGAVLHINAHTKACYTIDWHPDGRHLVSGGFDKYARVWDLKGEKRQRAAWEFRAPQAILNVRWRPPCWSTDLTEKGHWQSAQLATSYTDDDPRVHIWDLRREQLPFRELDRYNSRPTDLLWASEDFLWTAGGQGMFVQTDIRDTAVVHDHLSTSTHGFMPDGSFLAFSEDTRAQRKSSLEDSSAKFLRIPQERLSGGRDGTISRSLSDDDDADDGLLTTSMRRRVSKSSRSAKSQGNTPPTGNGFAHIVPLDRSVLNRGGVFADEQTGMYSSVAGVAVETEVVEFLASRYAFPMTLEERKQTPSQILEKLHQAFVRNASVCDHVSMHRMAQSWRILDAVVVSELRDWADANRQTRLHAEAKRRSFPSISRSTKAGKPVLSHLQLSRAKVMNNLFKGVLDSELQTDIESTSNMTTPTAKPLPDSPVSPRKYLEDNFLSLNEITEPIPPLPPSIMSAHSTAAAASQALMDSVTDESPASSPEKTRRPALSSLRHRRTVTDIPVSSVDRNMQVRSPQLPPPRKQVSGALSQPSPRMDSRKQEDRRAAMRDFRIQQRQLFTLDEPVQSPRYAKNERHDSAESFTMFSNSTDSSHRARSLGQSLDLSRDLLRGPLDSDEWQSIHAEELVESPPLKVTETQHRQPHAGQSQDSEDGNMQEHFPMDETSRVDFGLDGARETKAEMARPKPSAAASMWDIGELRPSKTVPQAETAASSASGELFLFEETSVAHKPRIYTSNPIPRIVSKSETTLVEPLEAVYLPEQEEDTDSKEYVYSDFRPIDFTAYEPKRPYAWSALPLLCHSIAFDMLEGIASAQFSVHLLMHLYPFFFDPVTTIRVQPGVLLPDSIAERLIRPDLSHRIIEGLFLNHYLYLKKLGLYRSMTEVKKTCVDLGFEQIFEPTKAEQPVGASLKQDPFQLQMSCSHCYSFMPINTTVCQNCKTPRTGCPVCQQLRPTSGDNATTSPSALWTFCQACGHSAHWSCMQEWMLEPTTEGECPTRNCGCDCGPGLTRQIRITRLLRDAETTEIIRGSRTSSAPRRDPLRASHSPAVDKTRDTLRNTGELTRENSVDDRFRRSVSGVPSVSGSSRGGSRSGFGVADGSSRGTSQSFGRRVRLVTPGEEG